MDEFKFLLIIQTTVFYGLFFISGLILKFFPPKKNKLYGFRSKKALHNDVDWYLAQQTASTLILLFSGVFFLVSILIKQFTGYMYSAFTLYTIIDSLLLLVGTFMIYFLTEDKLRHPSSPNATVEEEEDIDEE